METYGVSFEGFQPSCGWPMYKHIEEDLIPYLKNEVVRWRARRDASANEWAALKGLKGDVEGMMNRVTVWSPSCRRKYPAVRQRSMM